MKRLAPLPLGERVGVRGCLCSPSVGHSIPFAGLTAKASRPHQAGHAFIAKTVHPSLIGRSVPRTA